MMRPFLLVSLFILACASAAHAVPPPAPSPLNTFVPIYPGQDIQSAITVSVASTKFLFKTGVHRMADFVIPKTGNTFIGEPGAILNGSQDITSNFMPSGGKWVATGMTMENPTLTSNACQDATSLCKYPNDVYFNNVPLVRVATAGDVTTGKFHFDLATDTITIGDDPGCCNLVEVGVATRAFKGFTTGVTTILIKGLIFEKFATEGGIAPVNGRVGWTIEGCESRLNHAIGFQGQTIKDSYAHHNGQFGVGGSGDNILIENNEISYNNYAGYHEGYAGGSKFTSGDGLIVRGNLAHHNIGGAALWTDGDNINVLYENNIVRDNEGNGLSHEIGQAAIIRNNTFLNNNTSTPTGSLWNGSSILINASRDTEVYGNTVEGQKNGITIIDTGTRGTSPTYGPRIAVDNSVHDNTVKMVVGAYTGLAGDAAAPAANNLFATNTYYLINLSSAYFNTGPITKEAWQALGQDTAGTFLLWTP